MRGGERPPEQVKLRLLEREHEKTLKKEETEKTSPQPGGRNELMENNDGDSLTEEEDLCKQFQRDERLQQASLTF